MLNTGLFWYSAEMRNCDV